MKNLNVIIDLMIEESFGSLNLRRLSELRIRPEPNRHPSASNPRSQPRYMSGQLSASSFAFSLTRFQALLACSQAAIFIDLSKSLSTLLIASFLAWIYFTFFFHKL